MSDRYPASITIGGKIKKSVIPDLVKAVVDQGVCLEFGGNPVNEDDFSINEGGFLALVDSEARNGEFYELEDFLRTNNIAFSRNSSSFMEFQAELVLFDPDNSYDDWYYAIEENAFEILIPTSRLMEWRENGTLNSELDHIYKAERHQLAPISIVED